MVRDATVHFPYVPFTDWLRHGTWKATLEAEIAAFPGTPTTMSVQCVSWSYELVRVLGINVHGRGGVVEPMPSYEGYTYCWDTTDGRGLDVVIIKGKFNPAFAIEIMEKLERSGASFKNRWDMLISFH